MAFGYNPDGFAYLIDEDQEHLQNGYAKTDGRRSALSDATRQPLSACHFLVKAEEVLEQPRDEETAGHQRPLRRRRDSQRFVLGRDYGD